MNNAISEYSPWTNLQIKFDLYGCLNRTILTEKFNKDESTLIEMTDFIISKLHDCFLFTHKEYLGSIFYGKQNGDRIEILLEKDTNGKGIYLKYKNFWEVFELQYGLSDADIKIFTQYTIEIFLQTQGYTTDTDSDFYNDFGPW